MNNLKHMSALLSISKDQCIANVENYLFKFTLSIFSSSYSQVPIGHALSIDLSFLLCTIILFCMSKIIRSVVGNESSSVSFDINTV